MGRGCCRTANPSRVLVWNTEKRYPARSGPPGIPVVPTVFLEPGEALDVPRSAAAAEQRGDEHARVDDRADH
jgi:hypothetical protein